MNKKLQQAEQTADERREITIEEAQALPNLLGRIATAMLRRYGFYGYVRAQDGHKVLLVLVER